MFVRQLIGREAGTIIELPYHAATASLGMGTCAAVTDDEIAEAGLTPARTYSAIRPDEMPQGYRAISGEGGGFDVIDAGGVVVNQEFIPNLPAARSFALALAGHETPAADEEEPELVLEKMTRAELDALAAERGIDISEAKNKADVIAALNLRDDGPTIAEFVAAGYSPSNYPPKGYASRSTPEEIEEALNAAKAEVDAKVRDAMLADLGALSDEDLAKVVEAEKIAVVAGDTKDAILGKIADARIAAQG